MELKVENINSIFFAFFAIKLWHYIYYTFIFCSVHKAAMKMILHGLT